MKCNKRNYDCMPADYGSPMMRNSNCCGVKRTLAPVLVAKVYNQTIIEEIPNSAMSMTLDNTATITNAYSDGCADYSCNNCRDIGCDICNVGCNC